MEIRYTSWTPILSLAAHHGKQGARVDFHMVELNSFTEEGWD
jgi:hypothetical protein